MAPRPGRSCCRHGIEGESDQLNEELARVNEQLRTTIERSAVQVEEAKAANEELQAMNEELRSSAEELETSKEELQSSNEELATVNQELKIKIDELAASNNDFLNLMTSTEMGAVFLDRAMRVKLSTPRAQEVFNLRPTDVGRRLSDITNRLLYDGLYADIETVLRDLQMIERQVETKEGDAYVVRIHPYRTSDDRIEGVALTFQDITARTRTEEHLRLGEERFRLLIDSAVDYAIFTMNDGAAWTSGTLAPSGCSATRPGNHRRRCLDVVYAEDRAARHPAAGTGTRGPGRAGRRRALARSGRAVSASTGAA